MARYCHSVGMCPTGTHTYLSTESTWVAVIMALCIELATPCPSTTEQTDRQTDRGFFVQWSPHHSATGVNEAATRDNMVQAFPREHLVWLHSDKVQRPEHVKGEEGEGGEEGEDLMKHVTGAISPKMVF